jgi:hypothetical protein
MRNRRLGWDRSRRLDALASFEGVPGLSSNIRLGWDALRRENDSRIVYQDTVTGLRISAVDGGATESGGAFIDGANASITALADGNHQIEIYDSAGRMIKGVLKAPGSAETLSGTELVTNGAFTTDTTDWTPVNATIAAVAGGDAGNCLEITRTAGPVQTAWGKVFSATANRLYRSDSKLKDGSVASQAAIVHTYRGGSPYTALIAIANLTSTASWVLNTGYGTCTETAADYSVYLRKNNSSVGTLLYDTISVQQVLTPSTSGATIVSAKGGVTYNFSYKHASFVFNAASYYVIVRKLR